jgi:hypothetical protein
VIVASGSFKDVNRSHGMSANAEAAAANISTNAHTMFLNIT